MKLLKGYSKQETSWMMYDWANSAHSVIVVTILPIFYNTVAEYTGDAVSSMSTWGYATSAAMAIVALLAPVLQSRQVIVHDGKKLLHTLQRSLPVFLP